MSDALGIAIKSILDMTAGMNDCKGGIYDKWYTDHRSDYGAAYNQGWRAMNHILGQDNIQFIG